LHQRQEVSARAAALIESTPELFHHGGEVSHPQTVVAGRSRRQLSTGRRFPFPSWSATTSATASATGARSPCRGAPRRGRRNSLRVTVISSPPAIRAIGFVPEG